MISEAIETISRLVGQAQRIERVDIPGVPPHVVYIQNGDTLEKIEIPPPRTRAYFDDLGSIEALDPAWFKTGAIFVSPGQILIVRDVADLRDQIVVNLRPTYEWQRVAELAKQPDKVFDQAALRRLLLIDLERTGNHRPLADAFSAIVWADSGETRRTINQTKESLGRDILNSVSAGQAQTIPEEIVFSVRRWQLPDFPQEVSIRVRVEPDYQRHAFALIAYPSQWEDQQMNIVRALRERVAEIVGDACPVYTGSAAPAKE